MTTELEQARQFCLDFFGTTEVAFDGCSFADTLASFLARTKVEMLQIMRVEGTDIGTQLELFEGQGVLFS